MWCSQCHTEWTESVLNAGGKCPFKDCEGYLSHARPTAPVTPTPKPKPKPKKTFSLLETEK